MPPLFGLAPGGVCHAAAVTGSAVGSYPTLSTWPDRSPVDCFLWHFPWGRPRRALPGTVFPWSPDFPRPRLRGAAAARPSGGWGYSEGGGWMSARVAMPAPGGGKRTFAKWLAPRMAS